MNKKQLVRWAAKRANFSQDVMRIALDSITSVIIDNVAVGEPVKIENFGTFYREYRNARTGRDIRKGKTVKIPASESPRFRASPTFKDAVSEMSRVNEEEN